MSAIDFEIATIEEKYLLTIKQLRLKSFSNNLPFLILSETLPEGQVYREFADGHIELQEVSSSGSKFSYSILHTLTTVEANQLRKENGLL